MYHNPQFDFQCFSFCVCKFKLKPLIRLEVFICIQPPAFYGGKILWSNSIVEDSRTPLIAVSKSILFETCMFKGFGTLSHSF